MKSIANLIVFVNRVYTTFRYLDEQIAVTNIPIKDIIPCPIIRMPANPNLNTIPTTFNTFLINYLH